MTGGRDHLTHRLLPMLGSPRAVAATLGSAQVTLCAAAIAGAQWGDAVLVPIAATAAVLGVAAVVVLDSSRWRPTGIAVGEPAKPVPAPTTATAAGLDTG